MVIILDHWWHYDNRSLVAPEKTSRQFDTVQKNLSLQRPSIWNKFGSVNKPVKRAASFAHGYNKDLYFIE